MDFYPNVCQLIVEIIIINPPKLGIMRVLSLTELLKEDTKYLYPIAYSFTNNSEDAKDLIQDTLYRALYNKDKYVEGTNVKAWIYTIMRNIYINNYRKGKKMVKVSSDVSDDHVYAYYGFNFKTDSYSRLNTREILKEINRLPDILRVSFELYFKGYKYQEISTILGESLGTIKSRIHFARKSLVKKITR